MIKKKLGTGYCPTAPRQAMKKLFFKRDCPLKLGNCVVEQYYAGGWGFILLANSESRFCPPLNTPRRKGMGEMTLIIRTMEKIDMIAKPDKPKLRSIECSNQLTANFPAYPFCQKNSNPSVFIMPDRRTNSWITESKKTSTNA